MNVGASIIQLIQEQSLITDVTGGKVDLAWSADAGEKLASFVEAWADRQRNGPADELRKLITQQLVKALSGQSEDAASAAHIDKAIRWYLHLAGGKNDDLEQLLGLANDARKSGGRMPPLDVDGDDPVAKI